MTGTELSIQDLIRIERLVRDAKDQGQSSNMQIKIAEVQRLIDCAKKVFGEEIVEKEKKANNVVQYKPDAFRTRTYRSWQEEEEKLARERQLAKARADRHREKERRKRQEEQLKILARNFAGDLKTVKSA